MTWLRSVTVLWRFCSGCQSVWQPRQYCWSASQFYIWQQCSRVNGACLIATHYACLHFFNKPKEGHQKVCLKSCKMKLWLLFDIDLTQKIWVYENLRVPDRSNHYNKGIHCVQCVGSCFTMGKMTKKLGIHYIRLKNNTDFRQRD